MVRFKTKAEQAAEYFRSELTHGRWGMEMPGRNELASECGIDGKTVELALQMLVREGVLVSQGPGRRRRIVMHRDAKAPSLRVAVLSFDSTTRAENYVVDLVHQLRLAGHLPVEPRKTLLDMKMNVERVSKLVESTPADAWVIIGGSRGVLEWFTQQKIPAFALFGRRRDLPIAGTGPDKPPAMRELTRRLLELGHRRIVLITRAVRRLPVPGATERAFLETLESAGIRVTSYNLPDWEESPEGFHGCLHELFRVTPPTGVIVDEAPFFTAAMQFCAQRRLGVPEDLSLVCCESNPHFLFCQPPISHIGWDIEPVVRKILRWAHQTSLGREDYKQSNTQSHFVEGGTVGPVRQPTN